MTSSEEVFDTFIKESLNKLGAKIRKLMLNRQDCGKLFMKIKEERTRLCKQFPNLAPQISEMVSKRLLGELEPEFSEYIDRSIFDLKEGGPEKFKQINQNVNLLFNHIYNSTPLADRTGLEAKYHEFTEAYKSRF